MNRQRVETPNERMNLGLPVITETSLRARAGKGCNKRYFSDNSPVTHRKTHIEKATSISIYLTITASHGIRIPPLFHLSSFEGRTLHFLEGQSELKIKFKILIIIIASCCFIVIDSIFILHVGGSTAALTSWFIRVSFYLYSIPNWNNNFCKSCVLISETVSGYVATG